MKVDDKVQDKAAENTALPVMSEAETLAYDLKRVLVESESVLKTSEAKENIEKLERWAESYRRGLSAAQKISDNGAELLQKAHIELSALQEQILRLEEEGGPPLSSHHKEASENLAKALSDINLLMPKLTGCFGTEEVPSSKPESIAI